MREMVSILKVNDASELSIEVVKNSLNGLRELNLSNYLKSRTKMVDFYEGNQGAGEGDDPNYLKVFGFKDMVMPLESLNITKKIIEKISLLYKYSPDRVLYNNKGEEMPDDEYNRFISENLWFNEWRKQIEKYKKLLDVVISMPLYTENGWKPFIFTNYIPHFSEQDSFNPIAYSIPIWADLNNTIGYQEQKWLFVSEKVIAIHDESGGGLKPAPYFGRDDFENPLGIMPIVEERSSWPIVSQYWPEGAISLVNSNQAINVMLNDIQAMVHYQAFNEIVARGADQEDIAGMKRGPHKILATGRDAQNDIHSLQHNPLITESMETVRTKIENVAWSYNLSVNWSQDGSPQSGFSLLVKNMELMEARQNDETNAQMAEQKVYEIIKKQCEIFEGLDYTLPEATVFCNFDDSMRLPVNEKEQIENWQAKINANVKNYLDWIQSEEGVDEDQAEKIYLRNKEINATFTRGQQALRDVLNQVNNEPPTDNNE